MSRKVLFWWTLEYVDFIFGLNTCLKLSAVYRVFKFKPSRQNFFQIERKNNYKT